MAEWNDSPTKIAKEFNLRVDLNDPAVRDFLKAAGIPESDWGEFDRSRQAHPQVAENSNRKQANYIPEPLKVLGVIAVERYPDYSRPFYESERFVLDFYDGDQMEKSIAFQDLRTRFPHLATDTRAMSEKVIELLVGAVYLHRVLPFDTLE